MASGYASIRYRLSGVLPSGGPSLDDAEVLKDALLAYFLDDSLDSVSRDLSWTNFAIPGLLTVIHDFVDTDAHRIRLNEYMFRHLDRAVQYGGLPGVNLDSSAPPLPMTHDELIKEREDRVFGAISLFVDAGSTSAFLDHDYISTFMFDLFPGLETFLRMVNPSDVPFVTGFLSLESFSEYLTSIQVFLRKKFSRVFTCISVP